MLRPLSVIAAMLVALAAYAGPAALAAEPPLPTEVKLTALGGVSAKAPAWKAVRSDDAVVVLEQAPDPAQRRPFHVLMVAIEEGPPADVPVPWERIRDNVVEAASQAGRALSLTLGDRFDGAAGFEGRYLGGVFSGAGDQQVGLELIGLVREGRLVTVSLVSDAASADTRALLEAIAATVALGD